MALFNPSDILLPAAGADFGRWAVVACDQYTSQPEYWQKVEHFVGGAPSTLHIILPEAYLENDAAAPKGANTAARTKAIHASMREYLDSVLTRKVQGFVYVERTMDSGAVRQGLVGSVDLEEYSYESGAACRVRPSENTVLERIPPRVAVRRGAVLEAPHILMLIDDLARTVIEPIAAKKAGCEKLYDLELMLGGNRIEGWAVTNAADINNVLAAIEALDKPGDVSAAACNGDGKPFAMAVGDGNHSLAAAKALWEEIKPAIPPHLRESHPARFCLVELENIQSDAIEIESIHRVIFDADFASMQKEAEAFVAEFGQRQKSVQGPLTKGEQLFRVLHKGKGETAFTVLNSPWPLAAGTFEAFMAQYIQKHPVTRVDYIHGEDSVMQLAAQGAIGVLLPSFHKDDLFRGVALGGVLPKKTFSMGHANEKRYYIECHKILE